MKINLLYQIQRINKSILLGFIGTCFLCSALWANDKHFLFDNEGKPVVLEEYKAHHLLEITVSGRITDENGIGLPGTSIVEKGTTNGAISDVDGKFSVKVKDENSILVFSFTGYESQEILVGASSTIEVQMKPSATNLEDVVVVGYGTKKKVNLTGAISTVSSKDIASRPIGNAQQALQGLAPNLNITVSNAGGEPGAALDMSIRGLQSFGGSNAPFVLVDNIVMDINSINPNDIETISIL
jgi:hypothetical protein